MKSDYELPLLEHLAELKQKVFAGLGVYVLCACIFYGFVEHVLLFITKPIGSLYYTSPAGAFLARMSLTLWGGLFLSSPVLLYLLWRFIQPGLFAQEQKAILIGIPISIALFICGSMFAFFVALPISLKFFSAFSSTTIIPLITVNNYIQYVGVLLFVFGLVFEVPLVIVLLTLIGLVSPQWLAAKRRFMVVIMFFIAAFITPQDIFSMCVVAVPFILLYEVGVLFARLLISKKGVPPEEQALEGSNEG